MDFVLTRVKRYGRIAACGAISCMYNFFVRSIPLVMLKCHPQAYNNPTSTNLTNYFEVITNRLTIQGFVVIDYLSRPECMEVLRKAYNEGKLKNTGGETIVKAGSLEDVPKIWYRLFQGKNIGKLLTELP
ncbi:MAG TPA: hypothetical protein VGO47_11540 [Chlamydiales bacterium]|nr:hypothetical protein [Chlamydiales bacterium]